jgi:protein TonB
MASTITLERTEVGADGVPLIFRSIESTNLIVRLGREVSQAAREFASDPAQFVVQALRGQSGGQKRKQRLYAGVAVAASIYAVVLAVVLIMGFRKGFGPPPASGDIYEVHMVNSSDFKPPHPENEGGNGTGGSHASRGSGGGGGGGQSDPRPASQGVLPQMVSMPQIVAPTFEKVPQATLPIPVTVIGPDGPPPPPAPLGVPKGGETPSAGPGTGGGLGTGTGTGIGSGNGPGAGPGSGGGQGGGKAGVPNAPRGDNTSGPLDWRQVNNKPGFRKFEWTYRQHAVITPEAAAEQADGEVLLRATFNADGTITDIEVVNPVAHMTQSAIEALQHCRFRPATFNGEPRTLTHVLVMINVTTGVLK